MPNETRRDPSQAYTPRTQRELVLGLDRLPLPLPQTTRDLFRLFALCEPPGLQRLLDRVELSRLTPYQIYQIVHEREPERLDQVTVPDGYEPRKHLEAALLSAEFQQNVLRHFLHAFPEKRRDVFIHVPKCAGTDLILNLGSRSLSLPKMLEEEGWVSKHELFAALRNLVQTAPYYDAFFVHGHMSLGSYVGRVGVRAGDRVFSVIRDPLEIMLSQANYAVSRLRLDPSGNDPDTRQILARFEMERLPEPISFTELKRLAMRALLDPEIARPDQIAHYLGDHDAGRYKPAIANLVRYNVEVTTTEHYRRWLEERWGIASGSRHNTSDHWLSLDELDGDTLAELERRTAEDRKIYDVVSWVLEELGKSSVTGVEIAETVGPPLFEEFPEQLAPQRRGPDRANGPPLSAIKVVQGRAAIAAALDDPASAEPILRVVLGTEGNGKAFLREGWANPEARFAWTCAPASRIEVPKPTGAEDYTLRVLAGPFVVKDRLPSQRLTLTINGIELGTAVATDRALIEFPVPNVVLGGGAAAVLTFALPDAAKPSEITEAPDQRTLGFAVERIEFHRQVALDSAVGVEAEARAAADTAAVKPAPAMLSSATAAAMAPELMPDSELMMRFESLGENCEFGLVQRRCGAEPLGLFRFSSAPLPKLLAGLEARFDGLGAPENVEVMLSDNGREYMVFDRRFEFLYHAWVLADEMSPAEIHAREIRRLPFLVRKLLDDFADGSKIFVYHGMEPLAEAEIARLLRALRAYGPNTLLWVEAADAEHAPGTVEWAGPGLLKAYIDRFAPGENAHDLSLGCWTTICREAYRLRQKPAADAAE